MQFLKARTRTSLTIIKRNYLNIYHIISGSGVGATSATAAVASGSGRHQQQQASNNRNSRASTLSQETSDSDQCSIKTQITNSQPETPSTTAEPINGLLLHQSSPHSVYEVQCGSSDSSISRTRPDYLELRHESRQRFRFSIDSEDGGLITDSETTTNTSTYTNQDCNDQALLSDETDSCLLPCEPVSMPPMIVGINGSSGSGLKNNSRHFSYKNPAYQSANPSCGTGNNGHHHHHGSNGMMVHEQNQGKIKVKNSHSSEHDIPGEIFLCFF